MENYNKRLENLASMFACFSDFEARWGSKKITSEELFQERKGSYIAGYTQALKDFDEALKTFCKLKEEV